MREPPFYANTPDRTHCLQAGFRIMLKHFLPSQDFSWAKLDKMTHKVHGKGTWWFPMAAELQKLGLKTRIIEYFDYQRFLKEGDDYLYGILEPEVVEYFLKSSNLTEVKDYIPEFLAKNPPETRPATLKDLDKFLAEGWLAALDVNSRVLNGRSGYSGHVVVVYAKAGSNYMLHDPGLPPKRALKISRAKLLKAWQYTGKKNTAIFAVRA